MSRKKSVQEHVLNGTFRPSVHGPRPDARRAVPKVAVAGVSVGLSGRPRPPKLDPISLATWDELVGLLDSRVQPEDGPQLEQAACWLAKWRLIIVALDAAQPGTLAFTRLVSAASTASKSFDRIARKFGLSPLDRDALSLSAGAAGGPKRW